MVRNYRSRVKRYVKKQVKRVVKYAKKRYYNKGGPMRLYKDVKMLKRIINSEKKQAEFSVLNIDVAQWNGAGSGHKIFDTTPIINKGLNANDRVGNSVKINAIHYKLQVQQQSAAVNPQKIKFIFFMHKTETYSLANMNRYPEELYDNNDFNSTTIDLLSSRSVDYFRDFVILRTVTFYMPGDTSGTGTAQVHRRTKSVGIKFKKGHYLKYGPDNNNLLLNGNIYCLVLSDYGNSSTTTVAGDGQAINTGSRCQMHSDYYYYDN